MSVHSGLLLSSLRRNCSAAARSVDGPSAGAPNWLRFFEEKAKPSSRFVENKGDRWVRSVNFVFLTQGSLSRRLMLVWAKLAMAV
jgi:hypothetical protein